MTVTGPTAFSFRPGASGTLELLPAGTYTIAALERSVAATGMRQAPIDSLPVAGGIEQA